MTTTEIAKEVGRILGITVTRPQVSHARAFFGGGSDKFIIKEMVNYYEINGKMPRKSEAKTEGSSDVNQDAKMMELTTTVDATYEISDLLFEALNNLRRVDEIVRIDPCLDGLEKDLYMNGIEDRLMMLLGKIGSFRQKTVDEIDRLKK